MKALVVIAVLAACVEEGPGPQGKKIDPTYVQAHLLAAAPGDIEHFDVQVGDAAIYLGNKVDKTRVAPGQGVTITHYWKVLKTPGAQWNVFALVRGAPNTADFMNLRPTDMQLAHGPATWEPGEIIEDVQTIDLRPDWHSKQATVLVGLIERGKHGTLDRMAATGPKTLDRAIVARTVEVDLSRAPPPKGTVYVPRAQGAIAIDGVGTDPGWIGSATAELVTAEGGADPIGKAVAKLTWDDQYLYLFVTVTDTDVVSPYTKHDEPLWKADCIEMFIDADGNRRGYVELQANPLGVTFDSWFADTRAKPGDESWDSSMVAAAKLRGGVAAGDSGDQGWDVEIGIPWDAVKGRDADMKVTLPPKIGDRWRLNVVRVDHKSGDDPKVMTAASWNRITMADFHALDRMLVAVFADQTGSIVPQASAPPVTPAATTALPIAIPASGDLVVDGKQVADAALDDALRQAAGRDVALAIDKAAPHSRVVALLERAKRAGLARFVIGAAAPIDATVVVEVPATGDVTIAGKPVADAALDAVLRDTAAKSKQTQVVFHGASYARIVALIERAKTAGLAMFVIEPPGSTASLPPTGPLRATIDSPGSAGARSDAERRGVTIDSPGSAGARSDAERRGVTIDSPGSAGARIDNSLVIDVPASGEVVIAGKPIADADLDNLLRAAVVRDKATQVVFRAGKDTSHGRVIGLMERAKRTGITHLAFGDTTASGPLVLSLPSPQASSDVVATISIAIPAAGDVVINGKAVADAKVDSLLRAAFAGDKDTRVIFEADPGTSHTRVVRLMERAKQIGLARLAIATRPAAQAAATIEVTVGKTGAVTLAGAPVDDAALDKAFRDAAAKTKDTEVVITIETPASPERVNAVMDRAKRAGLTRISLGRR